MGPSLSAFADDGTDSLIDSAAIQQMVDSFVAERGINPENFSIGYVYTATGEEWYYNGDTWYYPASMYKVPLMMLLALVEPARMPPLMDAPSTSASFGCT